MIQIKSHHAAHMLEALLWYVYVCLPTGFNHYCLLMTQVNSRESRVTTETYSYSLHV